MCFSPHFLGCIALPIRPSDMDISFPNAVNLSNGADTASCAQATVPSQERHRLLNTCLFAAKLPVFAQPQPSSSQRKRRLLLSAQAPNQAESRLPRGGLSCRECPGSAGKAGNFMEEPGQVAEREESVDWGYEEGKQAAAGGRGVGLSLWSATSRRNGREWEKTEGKVKPTLTLVPHQYVQVILAFVIRCCLGCSIKQFSSDENERLPGEASCIPK